MPLPRLGVSGIMAVESCPVLERETEAMMHMVCPDSTTSME